MSKSKLELWIERYTEVQITRIRLYTEKLNRILSLHKDQFFPMWRYYHLEEVLECGEIVLEEFKLTPAMQGLVLEHWLIQDEIFRYKEKCAQTNDCTFLTIIKRLESRTEIVHQLFLKQLQKTSPNGRKIFLFVHPDTSLHIGHNWVCHILGHPDILKK